jgi:FkbM family methyltransferase
VKENLNMSLKIFARDVLKINEFLQKRGICLKTAQGYAQMSYPGRSACLKTALEALRAAKKSATPNVNSLWEEMETVIAGSSEANYWQNILDNHKLNGTLTARIAGIAGAKFISSEAFRIRAPIPYSRFLATLKEIQHAGTDLEAVYARFNDDSSRLAFATLFRYYLAYPFLTATFQSVFPMPVPADHIEAAKETVEKGSPDFPLLQGATQRQRDSYMLYIWLLEQYRIPGKCEVAVSDVVFDVGGCFGETAIYFSRFCGNSGKVFTFEPHGYFFSHLAHNVKSYPAVHPVHAGCGSEPGEVMMSFKGMPSKAAITTIDNFVETSALPRVDFIKMDIEGAESDALRGAAQTLKSMRPKLAICVYHRPDDIRVLSRLIFDAYGDACDLYMKNTTNNHNETVLFAVPK